MPGASHSQILMIFVLISVGLVGLPGQALYGGTAASAEASTYVFLADQSAVVQTGGIAGVHWTYSVEGRLRLTVDRGAGTAYFTHVNANATDDSPLQRTLDPNHLFNLTALAGTVVDDATLSFAGKASDGSDIHITVTLQDDLAHLLGQTTPPPDSADFFIFSLDAVVQRKYRGGTGEPSDPYQIATAADLIALGATPEDYGKHFVLTADIDLDPNLPGRQVFDRAVIAPDTNDTRNFQGVAFTGTFNGNHHTIKNLRIDEDAAEYLGLFGWIGSTGLVSNLSLDSALITGSRYLGGLAGYNSGRIVHCSTSGTVFSRNGGDSLGGLTGIEHGSISGCQANTHVEGGDNSRSLGGLAGSMSGGHIKNSHASGIVAAGQKSRGLGGLVGYLFDGGMADSYATGNVISKDASAAVGGLIGDVWASGNISQCYSTGSVTGAGKSKSIGGLIGGSSSSIITNCYATGTVSGYVSLGGLIGYLGLGSKIKNCYAIGGVYSNINTLLMGGLFGETAREYIWVNQCFWDVETSGLSTSPAGTGLTTARMQDIETYQKAGWDMAGDRADGTADIWKMPEGRGYPELAIPAQGYEPHILGGDGTPESPYRIATAEDLGAIFRYDTSSHYTLSNDIDLSGITWANAPVPAFSGTFDGDGHRITSLTIHVRAADSGIGLFGSMSGRIRNLGLESVSITAGAGSYNVGGLAGSNSGNIACSCVTGSISVAEGSRDIGGLVGFNHGEITYCYTMCNISNGYDSNRIGGLVGDNYGKITQCFAGGLMASAGDSTELGGLVGYNAQSDYLINSCFWDIEKSGLSESDGGTGLTTAQMRDPNVLMGAGWDFAHESDGPSDVWARPSGGGHPILWWQLPELQWPLLPSFSGGAGESDHPYLISTPDELNSIGYNPRLMAAYFQLIDDIDLADRKFFSIGNEIFRFSGVFDGNNHTISGFDYTSSNTDHAGLFGYVDGLRAEVKNLGLIDPDVVAVTEEYGSGVGSLIGHLANGIVSGCHVQGGSVSGSGHYIVGGLVGVSYGTITDCSVTCSVSGTVQVGGLAGGSHGTVTNCGSSGEVSGNDYVGGLLGRGSGVITNCSSSGNVSGNDRIGGLLGGNGGEITYCYSTGDVLSNGSEAGGLVGYNTGTISNSYAAGSVSGNSIVGGFAGSNGYVNKRDVYWEYPGYISNCYSTGSVSGSAAVGGLLGNNEVGSVRSCLWDKESSGQSEMCGTENREANGCDHTKGKTTAEMQIAGTFLEAGWDLAGETTNGTEDIWWIRDGKDYPHLWWELIPEN